MHTTRHHITTLAITALAGGIVGFNLQHITPVESAHARMPALPVGQPEQPDMDLWIDAGTPDEHHQVLAAIGGEWDADASWFVTGDPDDPVISIGEQTNRMILGGRYLTTHYTADLMGQPFEGHGVLAYDKINQTYVATWIDSTSTMILIMVGEYDEDSKSLTLTGDMKTPDGNRMHMKHVYTFNGADEYTFEIHDAVLGKEWNHTGTIEYTR